MKTKTSLLIFVAILLVSCAPAAVVEPTSMVVVFAPTATKVLLPTETFTPESATTVTPIVIPDYMNKFIEKGYNTMSGNGILYMVNQEGKSGYAGDKGIMFNGLQIMSWMTGISYFDEQGIFHNDGIILDGVCRKIGSQRIWNVMIDADQIGSDPICPTAAYFKAIRTQLDGLTNGNNQIYKGYVGVAEDSDRNKIFEGVFPIVDGKPQPATILGIGTVLPVTQVKYELYPFSK